MVATEVLLIGRVSHPAGFLADRQALVAKPAVSINDPHIEVSERPLSTHQAWTTPASGVDEFGFFFDDFRLSGMGHWSQRTL
ncbi:MAG: hypothetical protein ACJAR2_000513 [Ilumatobacter sp.]